MRLAGILKGGYFPLQDRIVDLVASSVRVNTARHHVLLDTCAGEGKAARKLADAWGCIPFCVELDRDRAAECKKIVPDTLHGSYRQLIAPDGFASVAYLNPPYLDDKADGGRQEATWIQDCSRWLAPGGLLVMVCPQHVLSTDKFESAMSDFKFVVPYRFPDPEYQEYGQIVLFGTKRDADGGDYYTGRYHYYPSDPLVEIGTEQYPPSDAEQLSEAARTLGARIGSGLLIQPTAKRTMDLPARGRPSQFFLHGVCPELWQPAAGDGVYGTEQWQSLTLDNGRMNDIEPLLPLRDGHVAQMLRAGHLDGSSIVDAGQPLLIKGSSEKIIIKTTDYVAQKELHTEKIVSRVSTLNMITGELSTFRADEEPERMRRWFERYGQELANAVRHNFRPVFEPGPIENWSGWDYDGMKPPSDKPLPGYHTVEVLPVQKITAAAVAERWKKHKSAVISGQTGTGKTSCGQAATVLAKARKVIVMCPTHIVQKWARECRACTGAGVVIPKSLKSIDEFFAGDAKYLILGKEYAKLGAPWRHAVIRKSRQVIREVIVEQRCSDYPYFKHVNKKMKETVTLFFCTSCGCQLKDGKGDKAELVTESWFGDSKRSCPKCSSALWQSTWLTKKTKRFAPARYINRRYKRRYSLIIDECFPGDTLVSTPEGLRRIDSILPGDIVRSFKDGAIVDRMVTRAIAKKSDSPLIEVVHEDGSFRCTPNHKIWTNCGFVPSGDLSDTHVLTMISDMLSCGHDHKNLPYMSERVPVRSQDIESITRDSCVLSEMRVVAALQGTREKATKAQANVHSQVRMVQGAVCIHQKGRSLLQSSLHSACEMDARAKEKDVGADARTCNPRTSRAIVTVDEVAEQKPGGAIQNRETNPGSAIPGASRRKRFPADCGANAPSRTAWMEDGALHPEPNEDVVQRGVHGSGAPWFEDLHRMRWARPPGNQTEGEGCQEGNGTESTWLGSPAIHQQGDPGGDRPRAQHYPRTREVKVISIRAADAPSWVYDLEVDDTHCYFADGVLVSNCHQFSRPDSDQSRAAQHLVSGAQKILAMTGTLYGGRASSIFHLLFKLDRGFRDLYKYSEAKKFVEDHGLLQTEYKLDDGDGWHSSYGYRRNNSGGKVREIPGCSPAMVGLLLNYTAFVKLEDLGVTLPPYREEVDLVQCDPKVLKNVRELQDSVKAVLREHPQLLSQYLMACLGYPDCPEHPESIGNDASGIIATAPADMAPLDGWPKDRRLAEIMLAERAAGHKGIVFFPQVGKRDPQPRVKALLESHGLRVSILRGDVQASKREEWIMKHEPNFDVLLTNGSLVETGLDLLFAKRIVVYGTYYSVFAIRQMISRSFRLGQDQPVVVTFLGYAGTMQETALKLIAKKTRASHQIEGGLGDGLADHDTDGGDFLMELAKAAAAEAMAVDRKAEKKELARVLS